MKITLAFDSFKGSLTSQEVADAFERGFRQVIPHCDIAKVAIADGGEGSVDALVETLRGEYVDVVVADPLGRSITAQYGIIDKGATAIIEMAAASGLTLLQPSERNPMLTSTYGTGEMIRHALQQGCRNFLVCIGGSATNDGGTGMLRALGYRFLDAAGNPLTGGGEILAKIARIDDSEVDTRLTESHFRIACDVTNPLYGKEGAAFVFAPQKGADEAMVESLDKGLRNYARAIMAYNGCDVSTLAGAGAAGGMGAGFSAFLHARLVRGADMILQAMQFDKIIADSDVVFTGEGCIDTQTLMGKAPSAVLQAATAQGIDTIAVGGTVKWCEELGRSPFKAIIAIAENMPIEQAMQHDIAVNNVTQAAQLIAQKYYT